MLMLMRHLANSVQHLANSCGAVIVENTIVRSVAIFLPLVSIGTMIDGAR